VTRELDGPVRCHQAEAVPAVPPCLADPTALEDDVLDTRVRELMAHAQTCLTASDDDNVDPFHRATKGISGHIPPEMDESRPRDLADA